MVKKDKNVIIILVYNDSQSALNLLNNIEAYEELEKIIVVDNCSTDDSYDRLQKRRNEHIHVIKTQSNDGIAAGNNFGAEYAKKVCPDVNNFIFSNPEIFLLSCPPPCGHFSIQESAGGGLSYKVKKTAGVHSNKRTPAVFLLKLISVMLLPNSSYNTNPAVFFPCA